MLGEKLNEAKDAIAGCQVPILAFFWLGWESLRPAGCPTEAGGAVEPHRATQADFAWVGFSLQITIE